MNKVIIRIKTLFANNDSKFLQTWLFLIILSLIIGLRYHNNDDYDMVYMVKGFYPFKQNSFLYYSSSILGNVYTFFYNITDRVEWYIVIYILISSFSLSVISHVIRLRAGYGNSIILGLLFILLYGFGIDLLTQVTFTHAAGISSIAGMMLILWSTIENSGQRKIFIILLGTTLVFIGSLYRYNMAILMVCIIALAFLTHELLVLVFNWRKFSREVGIIYFKKFGIIIAPIIFIITINVFEKLSVSNEQKEFVEWQNYRADILDNNILQKSENKEKVLKAGGWKRLEEELFFNWTFLDIAPYDLINLRNMQSAYENKHLKDADSLLNAVKNIIADNIYTNTSVIMTFILCFFIVTLNVNWPNILTLLLLVFTLIGIIVYITLMHKEIPDRVMTLVLLVGPIILLYITSNVDVEREGRLKLGSVVLFSALTIFIIQNARYVQRDFNKERGEIEALDESLQNAGIKDFVSIPDNYPAYFHDDKLITSGSTTRPKVYFIGPFYKHPNNIGYTDLWNRDSIVRRIDERKLVFYFRRKNYKQMLNTAENLRKAFGQYYGMKTIYHIDTLTVHGFLLRYETE